MLKMVPKYTPREIEIETHESKIDTSKKEGRIVAVVFAVAAVSFVACVALSLVRTMRRTNADKPKTE